MNKFAILLSHGADAFLIKEACTLPIKSDYPELHIDPKKVTLGGKITETITETENEIILEKKSF